MVDYIYLGVDFHAIRNKNEARVIDLMADVLPEFPDFHPNRTDVEDIYALTLNNLPARYVQPVSLVMDEPVTDEIIKMMLREAIRTVRTRPNT